MADTELRIAIADPRLDGLLQSGEAAVGTTLGELFPNPELGEDLRLLRSGVAREVRLQTLENEQCLVATFATTSLATGPSFIVVRSQPVPPPPPETDAIVGRQEELEGFDDFLAGPDGSMLVVEGPLGIGKSVLLDAFERRCARIKAPVFRLDARALTYEGDVLSTLAAIHNSHGSLLRMAGEIGATPWVLAIDHFDIGPPSADDPRGTFFRSLPPSCRLVVAVRSHPKPFAFLFPRHRPITMRLGPLAASPAAALAATWGVDETDPSFLRAAGHPSSIRALSPWASEGDPLHDLAYYGDLPVPRSVLKVAAIPRRITEDLLSALLDDAALAARTYDALGSLCMNDPDNLGLRMPEVLRSALTARLARRNPERYATLRLDVIRYLLRRLERTSSDHFDLVMDDLFDSFDGHAGLRRVFGHPQNGVPIRQLGPADLEETRAFLRLAGRADATAILDRLRRGTPTYAANRDGRLSGLFQFAVLSSTDAALERFAHSDEVQVATLLSFVLHEGSGKEYGVVGQTLAREHLRLLLGRRELAASLVPVEMSWRVLSRPSDEVIEIQGAPVALRNFEKVPLIDRLVDLVGRSDVQWQTQPSTVVAQVVTTESVRQALLGLGEGKEDQQLIDAVDAIPDVKQREVLRAIYIERRGKHEVIAAELGLAYSTFRRHHARGLDQVRDLLITAASTATMTAINRETRDDEVD